MFTEEEKKDRSLQKRKLIRLNVLFQGYLDYRGIIVATTRQRVDTLIAYLSSTEKQPIGFEKWFSKIHGNIAELNVNDLNNKDIVGEYDFFRHVDHHHDKANKNGYFS